jgi:uncharacterized membrane protein
MPDKLPPSESRFKFRPRSHGVSRIEAFSDVVFGFSLTLLVVSLEVPRTFDALLADMRGFVPFAMCFSIFALVWWEHHNFFRRYGLEDGTTATLNFILLFVMLLYTYPLKFLFTGIFNEVTGYKNVNEANGQAGSWLNAQQTPTLMIIYGLGYATVFLVFVLLYWNALRQKRALQLTALEIFDTHSSMIESGLSFGVGTLCAATAAILPIRVAGLAGYLFFLIPIGMTLMGMLRGKARRKLEAFAEDQPANG